MSKKRRKKKSRRNESCLHTFVIDETGCLVVLVLFALPYLIKVLEYLHSVGKLEIALFLVAFLAIVVAIVVHLHKKGLIHKGFRYVMIWLKSRVAKFILGKNESESSIQDHTGSTLKYQFYDGMTGEAYEMYVAKRLESEHGFTKIQMTKTSGDYGTDIIAVDKNGVKTAIQCKRYHSSVGVEAVQQASSGAIYYSCDRAMVITNSTFTKNAQIMAKRIGVELWEKFC